MPGFPDSASTFVKVANFCQTTVFARLGIVNMNCKTTLRVVSPTGFTHVVRLTITLCKKMTVGRSESLNASIGPY